MFPGGEAELGGGRGAIACPVLAGERWHPELARARKLLIPTGF